MSRSDDVARIEAALAEAAVVLRDFTPGAIEASRKQGGDPVTAADTAINEVLLAALPRAGEGWLSEESADDESRLSSSRVWVVDPLDGTREFVEGIPEWCVSVGLVEDGVPVAGGILAPSTDRLILGALGVGVTLNGGLARARVRTSLEGAEVLASRSEVKRGEWERFAGAAFHVVPCGSVALKLGLVAAGLTDATWTLVPKHEWDVAGGAALMLAAGGRVWGLDGKLPRFNRPVPKLEGFLASPAGLVPEVGRVTGYPLRAQSGEAIVAGEVS